MPSHQRNHTAVIRWMLIVCLLCSGSSLEAQIEAPTPVPTQEAPSKSKETSDDSELKIQNYQLRHAKAAEILKLFKQLHGGGNTATVDERTNSIVFLANETNARELRESLALLDGDAPPPIIPPTPVVQGSSPKVPSPAKSKPAGPFRKFIFKHAKVADVVKILRELTGANIDNEDMEGFAVDERTNSVIWKVRDEWESQHWEETLLTLDGESSTSRIQSAPSPHAAPASMPRRVDFAPTPNSQVSAQPTQTFTFSMGFERGESVESLQQRYNDLEKQTHELAGKLKQSKSLSETDRKDLQTAVRKSFEARQALQRAELADLAGRMKSMQQSIDMREKLADKVVERRVEDLLNPNLKWDLTEPTAIARTESSSKPKSIKEAVSEILLNAKGDSVPYKLAAVGILYEGKAEVGDFKEEIFEQVEAEARTFAHFQLISRRVADAAMAESRLRLKDLFVAENTKSLFPVMTKFGQSMDFLLLLRLEEVDVSRGESEGNFRLTLRLVDKTGQTLTEQIDVSKGKRADDSKQFTHQSTTGYASPQEFLDAVEQHGKSGSYEDFVTLFNDEGVRDLAGSLLMSALMLTSMDELSRQQTTGGLSEVDPGTVVVRKVLQRWLPQSLSADQREYVGKGLSTMMSSIGGASPDQAALKEFVISMRKSVEGITDHRKFCVEMMQGYEKLTTKPFVYFGNADQKNEWQISQFGDRAIATLIDGSPGMATTITLQQASGDWRISSLFNELVEMTKEDESVARPITPAMEIQQRLQGEWDVKVMGYSPDMHVKQPYQAVVRGQLFLLQCMEDGKVIGTSTWKMIWPEADHPDVVDIVWDPNNNSDEYCAPGRITCDGKSFQVAWRSDDSISGPAIRPTEISSGDGISYFECVRKQPADPSPTSTSSGATVGPKYSGHPISWWLDSYWDNATAIPRTAENAAQEYVASEAIRKLREKPEFKAAIEAALAKWFASVEHEVNEIQLVRAAKCFVTAAGQEHQELAVDYLFKIWKQFPTLSWEKQIERLGEETELNDLLKQIELNDELANKFAERLTNGTSSDRSLVTYYLISSTGLKDEKDPKVAELNAWLHNHRDLFFPAFSAALKDESEHIRWFSLASLIGLDPKHASILSTLTSVIESDASPKVRWLAIEMFSSKELLSVAKTQNIEITPLLIQTLQSDSSVDVRYAALGALMAMDKDSELVHATLLEWARCKERLQVENALYLMLRNHEVGDRPQSIDELIELLSDSEWGTTVEVKQNSYRWARQYAIANLGEYAAHAHRAIPTLEAELARKNKDTLSFATEALDRVRGYCPDRPIEKLQGDWEFVSMQKPEGSTPFFDFRTSSDQPSSVITISGTQLKLGERVLAELSHYRSGSRQGVALQLDPDGKKRHCHGGYNFKGGPSPEYKPNLATAPESLILEVSELLNNWDATQASKQIYEFRRVIGEPKLEAPTP